MHVYVLALFITVGSEVGILDQTLQRVYKEAFEGFTLFSRCLHCSKSITSSQSVLRVGGIVNQLGVRPD